jgi:hypothetical protein
MELSKQELPLALKSLGNKAFSDKRFSGELNQAASKALSRQTA